MMRKLTQDLKWCVGMAHRGKKLLSGVGCCFSCNERRNLLDWFRRYIGEVTEKKPPTPTGLAGAIRHRELVGKRRRRNVAAKATTTACSAGRSRNQGSALLFSLNGKGPPGCSAIASRKGDYRHLLPREELAGDYPPPSLLFCSPAVVDEGRKGETEVQGCDLLCSIPGTRGYAAASLAGRRVGRKGAIADPAAAEQCR
nr:hypothetical protein Iba_chr04fCG14640 [Ipomoea batatas]